MENGADIKRIRVADKTWYKKIWTLDIQDASWVEQTCSQVDFLVEALGIREGARVLDLACGFGRHAIELARRGCQVVGIDITSDYVAEARRQAQAEGLVAEFHCMDVREVSYRGEFDIVLNMADGAIGYLEDDAENERIFEVAARALKPGGRYLIDICNADYARKHFPLRNWVFGNSAMSLADFEWDEAASTMYYGGMDFKYGEPFTRPVELYSNPTRLYAVEELSRIFRKYGLTVSAAYDNFRVDKKAGDDSFQIEVASIKA